MINTKNAIGKMLNRGPKLNIDRYSKNQQMYTLYNTETKETIVKPLSWIMKEINRDRSSEWSSYNKRDWKEGLEHFTEYKLIR